MKQVFPFTNQLAQQFVIGQLKLALSNPNELGFKSSAKACLEDFENACAIGKQDEALHRLHKACQYMWGSFPPNGIQVRQSSVSPFTYEAYINVESGGYFEATKDILLGKKVDVTIKFTITEGEYSNCTSVRELVVAMIRGHADFPKQVKIELK